MANRLPRILLMLLVALSGQALSHELSLTHSPGHGFSRPDDAAELLEHGEDVSSKDEEPPVEGEAEDSPSQAEVPEKGEVKADSASDDDEEDASGDPAPFAVRWQNVLSAFRSLIRWDLFGGRLTIVGNGSLQIDGTAGSGSALYEGNFGEIDNGFDLRRLRLSATGEIDSHLRYFLSFDVGADAGFKDVYIEGIDKGLTVWGYDIGRFRLGSFGEPFSMERRTSRHSLSFLERSLPVWTFAPGHNIGFMLFDTARNERVSWQAGFFSFGNKDEDNASASALSVTGRITWLPLYRDEGRTLLHLGASWSSRDPRSGEVRYRSRPEARFVNFLVDTGEIESNKVRLAGLEIAYKQGRLWAHGEWIQADVDSSRHGDPRFWGAFAQVGFFLTGESRPYNRDEGIWGRVDPISGVDSGMPLKERLGLYAGERGAVQVSGRISTIDLNDASVFGGEMTNFSAGLSWYPSHQTRWMLDYTYSDIKGEGNANIVLLRYQYRLY